MEKKGILKETYKFGGYTPIVGEYNSNNAIWASTDQIKEQLISSNGDKFTEEQAEYAVQHLED